MKDLIKKFYLFSRKRILKILYIFLPQKIKRIEKREYVIKKALFIRIDRIGDIVLSIPALKAFKNRFPDCELSVLASRSNHAVLINLPYVDNIIIYDKSQSFIEKIGILRKLRNYGFNLAVDPYSSYELKTALIAVYSGAPIRIGYPSYGREIFFNMIAKRPVEKKHFEEEVLKVLSPLGIENLTSNPEICLSNKEKEWSTKWIRHHRLSDKPIVGLHPGAYYKSQRWPAEYFSDLINKIEEDGKFLPILFHGPTDRKIVTSIKIKTIKDIPIFNSKDLRKFIALQSRCSVFICNNSGPLHVAAALGIHTISFMGPTDKLRWMPIGRGHNVLRVDSLPCIGCKKGYCKIKTHDCMRLINPSIVFETLNQFFLDQGIKLLK